MGELAGFVEIFRIFLGKLFVSPCQIRAKFFSKKIFLVLTPLHFFVRFSVGVKKSGDFKVFGTGFALGGWVAANLPILTGGGLRRREADLGARIK